MKNNIREILDETNISIVDELNILEYIDELEHIKEEYIKSLDKLDVLDNRIDKAIEFIEEHNIIGTNKEYLPSGIEKCYSLELMEILRGKDNENNSI